MNVQNVESALKNFKDFEIILSRSFFIFRVVR